MTRVVRSLGMGVLIVTSLVTALSSRDRGAIFWASVAIAVAAAIGLWRVLKEPSE